MCKRGICKETSECQTASEPPILTVFLKCITIGDKIIVGCVIAQAFFSHGASAISLKSRFFFGAISHNLR